MHLAEHRRRCVREGDTVSVEAIDRVWDDAQRHNKSAGPGDVAQARREMQRRASQEAHDQRAKAGERRVQQIVEQGRDRATGIRPDAFGESGDKDWNPGAGSPTKRKGRRYRPPHV